MNQENYDYLKKLELEEVPAPLGDREHYFLVRDMFGHPEQVIGTDMMDRGLEFLKICPVYVMEFKEIDGVNIRIGRFGDSNDPSKVETPEKIALDREISRDMLKRKLESMK
jgi:hypothetical protein